MTTPAKELHDLLQKILSTNASDSENFGRLLANISKEITGAKDGGASLLMMMANLIDQIEKKLKSIQGLETYHFDNYFSMLKSSKKLIAPNTMSWNWNQFKEVCRGDHLLSNLITLDFLLAQKGSKSISSEEIAEISSEMSDLKSLLDEVNLPKHAATILRLEIEKLEHLLRSDVIWNEEEFFTLYSSLTAQILATSELFKSSPDKTRNLLRKMFSRVRSGLTLLAEAAQMSDVTTKGIALIAGGDVSG